MSSVVIVGGGLAGLACAWRLSRAGHDVEVLELEGKVGGRARDRLSGELLLPQGARFVTRSSRNLLAVAGAVGQEVRPESRGPLAVLRAGSLRRYELAPHGFLRSPLLSASERLRLARFALGLWRQPARLEPLRPETAAPLDGSGRAAELFLAAGAPAFQYGVGPLLRFTLGCELEDLSPAAVLLALRFVAQGPDRLSLEGGLGRLTQALAERLPVRLRCEVTSVETESGGARVRYRAGGRDRSAVADAAVLALPGCLVARICPKLTPTERGFFESVRYVRGIVVGLITDGGHEVPPFESVAIPAPEGLDISGVDFPDPKSGCLVAQIRDQATSRYWSAPDAELAERVAEALGHTPIGPVAFRSVCVRRLSSMRPCFDSGTLQRLQALCKRTERSPRLAFAGDYLVGPSAEAALTSGMRAAAEIARSLDAA